MRNLMCLAVSAVLLSLTACGKPAASTAPTGPTGAAESKPQAKADKPQDLIVGVWEIVSDKDKGTQEFKADGTIVMAPEIDGKPMTMNGKYKFVQDDLIEVEVVPAEGAPAIKQKLKLAKLTKDELVTKDEKDKEDKFKKKK